MKQTVELSGNEVYSDAHILQIQHKREDVGRFQNMLLQAPIDVHVTTLHETDEALAYLIDCGKSGGALLPNLILLDYDLKGQNSLTFLRRLRCDERLTSQPVCVMVNDGDEQAVRQSYKAGADTVLHEADGQIASSDVVNSIVDFWFKTADRYYV